MRKRKEKKKKTKKQAGGNLSGVECCGGGGGLDFLLDKRSKKKGKKRKIIQVGWREYRALRRETRNDSLVSGWEHGRVRHVGEDRTNNKKEKNLSGMDTHTHTKKTQKKNKQTDKREPGSWTSAVVISDDL